MVTNPILVALDLGTAEEAVRMARAVADDVGGFKVGLGLLHGPGPAVVAAIAALGKPVFADAKLHDIPTQVERAARQLARLGARWVTAHVSGSSQMLEAAITGAREANPRAGILGVSVLTSLDEALLAAVGIPTSPGKLVSRMARVAAATGCEGIVCSPKEIKVVADVAPELVKVVPGIRPGGVAEDDQRRVATPREALERGADYLVIGRPITRSPDPAAAAAAIAADLRRSNEERFARDEEPT